MSEGVVLGEEKEEMITRASIAPGSIIAVSNMLTTGRWLGIVVDREKGEKWLEENPSCIEPIHQEGTTDYLVRVLGRKFVEGVSYQSLQPAGEPSQDEIVHWAYVPADWCHIVATDGTTVKKYLQEYLRYATIGKGPSLPDGSWFNDLRTVSNYLLGTTGDERMLNGLERKYLAMLEAVLPK